MKFRIRLEIIWVSIRLKFREFKLSRYEKKNPNICKKCLGNGLVYSTYDPSPAGVALGSGYMTDIELCQHCYELNNCPQCGSTLDTIEGDDYDKGACSSECGWVDEDDYQSEYNGMLNRIEGDERYLRHLKDQLHDYEF